MRVITDSWQMPMTGSENASYEPCLPNCGLRLGRKYHHKLATQGFRRQREPAPYGCGVGGCPRAPDPYMYAERVKNIFVKKRCSKSHRSPPCESKFKTVPLRQDNPMRFDSLRPSRSASHRARRRKRLLPQYELMKPTEVIRRYIDAWNGRDAEALVAAFAQEGKFCNPHTYPWNRRRSAS